MIIDQVYPEEMVRHMRTFHPRALERYEVVLNDPEFRFVHYTSSTALLSILDNNEIWMRNVSCMNDYMEIQYGIDCLRASYQGAHGQRLRSFLEELHEGICAEIVNLFDGWSPSFVDQSYIFCISEHQSNSNDDGLGKLSMWRGYGGDVGVAIVMKPQVFLQPSDALSAYTSAVEYLTKSEFDREFGRFVDCVLDGSQYVKSLTRKEVVGAIFDVFKYAALCTKHPGFEEEKEWRVIYMHQLNLSSRLKLEHRVVNGIPQMIYKIPLDDVPSEGLIDIETPRILDRIIVGPTDYPRPSWHAIVNLLKQKQVYDAENKVIVSEIPFRGR